MYVPLVFCLHVVNNSNARGGANLCRRIFFDPYTREDLAAIITHTIGQSTCAIEPDVIALIAAGAASTSGDVRRAQEATRRAVEMAIKCGDSRVSAEHVRYNSTDKSLTAIRILPLHQFGILACALSIASQSAKED
eukprot:4125142-Pleurochrysis_carterae.AAC.4